MGAVGVAVGHAWVVVRSGMMRGAVTSDAGTLMGGARVVAGRACVFGPWRFCAACMLLGSE